MHVSAFIFGRVSEAPMRTFGNKVTGRLLGSNVKAETRMLPGWYPGVEKRNQATSQQSFTNIYYN